MSKMAYPGPFKCWKEQSHEKSANLGNPTVRNIIPAVPGLWEDTPIVGKENLHKIRLNESKTYLGVSITLLVEERIIFGLFWSVFPRIGTIWS